MKLPKVHAKIKIFVFEYNLHNIESSLPQYVKHKHLQDIIENKLSLTLCIKEMVEQ
jgi:hypothetical protein